MMRIPVGILSHLFTSKDFFAIKIQVSRYIALQYAVSIFQRATKYKQIIFVCFYGI